MKIFHIGSWIRATIFATLLSTTFASVAADGHLVLTSAKPASRWEDALISGNGQQGVMVFGNPLDETIVLNHEKCWVPAQPVQPDVPNMVPIIKRARELAKEGNFRAAGANLFSGFGSGNAAMFPEEALIRNGPRLGLNYVHPAGRIKIRIPQSGKLRNYRRQVTLDTGEIAVRWADDRGEWDRRVFVSRPDNVVVILLKPPPETSLECEVHLEPKPGWNETDIAAPTLGCSKDHLWLKTHYKHLHGLDQPDGYQAQCRLVCEGGAAEVTNGGVRITDAKSLMAFVRTDYRPVADLSEAAPSDADLAALKSSYDDVLESHVAVHGAMFRRAGLQFGDQFGGERTIEEVLQETDQAGPSEEWLNLIYAMGRYCLISSSGKLPPTLMGIWGDTWKPMWWGHYTNDSNLNLAISNGSVGNLPEMMESYFGWIETLYPDWQRNARQLYGCEGYMGAIAHGWRHGLAIAAWHEWTGAAGWLGCYFWQHYLLTGDRQFLAERVVPLFENIVTFYEQFLQGMEGEDGKFLIYPSISPENKPLDFAGNAPNATSEIAIIRGTFTALIEAYRELGIKSERISELEAFLLKVPDYRINGDGALAEWSYPGIKDNYDHRHNSHLHAVYPGVEINPGTEALYNAAKVAIRKRIEAGQGNKSAHGFMELGFYGARLQDPSIVWSMLDDYARSKFLYRSFISSHNPDHRIYNLDSILALPAILTEMCLYSRPGELNLLPGIPPEHLPIGRISGILARKAIVIDELKWNLPTRTISLTLTSKIDQHIVLSSRLGVKMVTGNGAYRAEDGRWMIHLQQNVLCSFDIGLREVEEISGVGNNGEGASVSTAGAVRHEFIYRLITNNGAFSQAYLDNVEMSIAGHPGAASLESKRRPEKVAYLARAPVSIPSILLVGPAALRDNRSFGVDAANDRFVATDQVLSDWQPSFAYRGSAIGADRGSGPTPTMTSAVSRSGIALNSLAAMAASIYRSEQDLHVVAKPK